MCSRFSSKGSIAFAISLCATFVSAAVSAGNAQVPDSAAIQAVFSLEDGRIAAYDPTQTTVRIFVEDGGALRETAPIRADGMLMAAATSPGGGFAYATGVTRGDPATPIRVHVLDQDQKSDRVTYEYSGERNQVSGLLWNQSRLWINFFESKYFTKIGYLTPKTTAGVPWEFTEVTRLRMGDSFDCLGDTLVVGRSYGDQQGEDGDLILFRNGVRELLPSYRGVRAVKLFGDVNNPSIVVADGWHSNYGQVAQARVSLLRKRQGERRYALEIIDRDVANYSFSRLFVFDSMGRRHIAAVGNKNIIVYSESAEGEWKKEVIHTQVTAGTLMDATTLRIDNKGALFVVSDGGLRVVRYVG
jgi:hypothetical protein